jgi:hypothetical protein
MGMIRKEEYVPEKPPSRSELVRAIRDLKPGESLIISGESLKPQTKNQIYSIASRERLSIKTANSVSGLRVWLKQPAEYPIVVEDVEEVEMSRDEKLANLRAMMSGEIPAAPKEVAQAISDSVPAEEIHEEFSWGA